MWLSSMIWLWLCRIGNVCVCMVFCCWISIRILLLLSVLSWVLMRLRLRVMLCVICVVCRCCGSIIRFWWVIRVIRFWCRFIVRNGWMWMVVVLSWCSWCFVIIWSGSGMFIWCCRLVIFVVCSVW